MTKADQNSREDFTTYELHVYYKQGFDLANYIRNNETTSDSLIAWASDLETSAAGLRKLASLLRGTTVSCDADNNLITLEPMNDSDLTILKAAASEQLVQAVEEEAS